MSAARTVKRPWPAMAMPLSLTIALAACAQAPGAGPNEAGPATAPITSTAPPVDPLLSPRPSAADRSGPSTTLSPGQGVPARLDCGTFTLGQADTLPGSAARCFIDAASAGHPARLKVTSPTVEGDPIPVTYTAGADGRTEVITDTRQDGFGPQQITRQTCQGPSPAAKSLLFTKCTAPAPIISR
ncbi:hypothetical protein OWR29_46945 [Actinoplanes sp. Pm04-4]|uniref:Lipoprotein n=1 Tax=Paractinoplanes pyxinae TaxID=2997416 RepID=A0ABT4BGC5_9ACTN|nr:hypothetical protein [Actinoplanes pyxinae]MCY1145589.1 hypothetical protein [Actinoplanes pyxinae]